MVFALRDHIISYYIPLFISEHLPSQPSYITEDRPQHRELHALLFATKCVDSFTSHRIMNIEGLRDGPSGLSSLSEKTRESNHLQMALQRQHFLLSSLQTLSVGPVGIEVTTSRMKARCSTNRGFFFLRRPLMTLEESLLTQLFPCI